MATLNLTHQIYGDMEGFRLSLGGLATINTLTVDGHKHIQSYSVATTTSQKLFDVTEDLADFDLLYIKSSQTIEVEFVVANGANQVVFVLPLVANLPLVLMSDNSRDSTHTEDWSVVGTAGNIEKITAYNTSASTATVDVVAIT